MSEADEALRRIEALIETLETLPDPAARRPARELLEVVLDLHGLALVRVASIIAGEPGGDALLSRLAEDAHVRAVLLLHGLHPDAIEVRVRHAVAELVRELAGKGVRLRVVAVSPTSARLAVQRDPGAVKLDAPLRQRIEAAIVDAAPELEELIIDGPDLGAEDWGAEEAMPEVSPALAS